MKHVLAILFLLSLVVTNPLGTAAAKTNAGSSLKAGEKADKDEGTQAIDDSEIRKIKATPTVQQVQTEEQEWFNKGYQASLAERYDEAIEYYKKALGINPDFADALANLGVTYMNKGNLDEALVSLKKSIALNSKNAGAHYNLGLVYDKKGNSAEAVGAYEKCIAINPNFARAYHNLGIAYFDKGLKTMAAECFYKAALLFDEQGETRSALNSYDALTLTESKELEQALSEKLFPEQHQKESEAIQ